MSVQEKKVTRGGEEHGLINMLANSVSEEEGLRGFNEERKKEFLKLKEKDNKLVKVRYINYQNQNERLEKPYCKYPGDNIRIYRLIPGETYDLPLGMVKEINENPGIQQRSGLLDKNGIPMAKDGEFIKIHELVPASSF